MKILDNNGKVVFYGNWYPSGVTVFFERMGKDVYEYSVMEYLENYWQDSLSDLIKRFPCFAEATNEDTILETNNNTYLIPWGMEGNDDIEAWKFWQKILEQEFPGYILEDSEEELEFKNYYSVGEAHNHMDIYKDGTNYFDGVMTYQEMYDMFKNNRIKFGEAETRVILSALTIAGAKFIN